MMRKIILSITALPVLGSPGLSSGCTTAAQPDPNAKSSQPQSTESNAKTSASVTNNTAEPEQVSAATAEQSSTPEPEPETGESGSAPECKAGEIDKDCRALPDGTPIHFPSGMPLGNCRAGTRVCNSGVWGACQGAIAPQAQDNCEKKNDDANCDGVPNAGCDCVTGQARPCGESNIGACKLGEQQCIDGSWSDACEGAVLPTKERCDGRGIDEDCDGQADQDDSECECVGEEQAYCERAQQKGDCKWGKKSCKEGKWGPCVAWAKPITEICGSREPVQGVQWTGDENCDGGIDTSPNGRTGPAGCVKMMLDQDGDGFGKIGWDLSAITETNQLDRLATACLCPDRPDIEKKKKEGWVPVNGRENSDCGDCPPGEGGELVYPGSLSTSIRPNACLSSLKWTVTKKNNERTLGDFDLNCDGQHTDPTDEDGRIDVLYCKPSGPLHCAPDGPGRLIPDRNGNLWCGGSFRFGTCVPIIKDLETDEGDEGDDSDEPKTEKVLIGCARQPTSRSHTLRCQ